MSNILESLNASQQEAVKAINGPVMVVAGAGSGKTRVLTYRLAYMLEQGINPFNILALTFTNKAAREMKDRIVSLVGRDAGMNVWMGTFHSIFARILRIESTRLGYDRNFTIYDSDDSKALVRKIVKELNLDPKTYTTNFVLNRISGAKSSLISAEAYSDNKEVMAHDVASKRPLVHEIYKLYTKRLKRSMAMDFDDLLFNMNVLLRDCPDLLLKYQQKFTHIMVDEFQDTNFAQYLIVRQLAANDENICVVGDDAQSIYSFRGANIQNILNFKRDYPDLKTVKLEQNYRSTQTIVRAANSVIAKNKNQIFKKVWTDNEVGNRIKVLEAVTDNEEAKQVISQILELKLKHNCSESDIAILYRTNAQSRVLEQACLKRGIPYKIYGGTSFYSRKEVKDMLAYFRLVCNNHDEDALFRIINFPVRGIGQSTIDKIVITAKNASVRAWDVVSDPHQYQLSINSSKMRVLQEFAAMIRRFSIQMPEVNAFDVAFDLAKTSGVKRFYESEDTPEGVARLQNLEELLNSINDFIESEDLPSVPGEPVDPDQLRTLDLFMQDIALITDADKNKDDDTDKVGLMSIHASKGLEFPYVFLTGLEENLFPNFQTLNSQDDLEEERRLFYVAVTRAEKQLFLAFAKNRFKWGQLNSTESSRFLDEIDSEFLERPEAQKYEPVSSKSLTPREKVTPQRRFEAKKSVEKPTIKQPPSGMKRVSQSSLPIGDSTPDSSATVQVQTGMVVDHGRFGRGKIVAIEGVGANKKATVFFPNVGNKQLLLKFARLKVVE